MTLFEEELTKEQFFAGRKILKEVSLTEIELVVVKTKTTHWV